jgi:Ser/Thr protein kinase RdoA (MazF antagonist)
MKEEIKFIQYLMGKELDVLKPKLAKNGNYLLIKDTPWGKYLACAFERVKGDRLDGFNSDSIEYTDDLITGYGKMLGKLHKNSSEYGKVSKKSCFEILEEVDIFIKSKLNDKEMVKNEIYEIRKDRKSVV